MLERAGSTPVAAASIVRRRSLCRPIVRIECADCGAVDPPQSAELLRPSTPGTRKLMVMIIARSLCSLSACVSRRWDHSAADYSPATCRGGRGLQRNPAGSVSQYRHSGSVHTIAHAWRRGCRPRPHCNREPRVDHLIPPGWQARMDGDGFILMARTKQGAAQ
jgi:hypothetical protein